MRDRPEVTLAGRVGAYSASATPPRRRTVNGDGHTPLGDPHAAHLAEPERLPKLPLRILPAIHPQILRQQTAEISLDGMLLCIVRTPAGQNAQALRRTARDR